MKKIHYSMLLILLTVLSLSCTSQKQTASGDSNIKEMMDSQEYTFVAKTVFPTEDSRYNTRNLFPNGSNLYQLTSRYDLRITTDSVVAYLPFFGRSYTAPIDPSNGGIKFTSTDFNYKKSMRKSNYEIEITPKDNRDVRSLFLTISPGGFASLRIINMNKTPISFNGNIESNN